MITAEELRRLLHYDPETGVFTWLPRPANTPHERMWNTRYAGKRAGTVDHYGYVVIKIGARDYKAHRLAWLYVHGEWPSGDLDHANGGPDDNRIANLRLTTMSQNIANSRMPTTNKSGFRGVSWDKDRSRWTAYIKVSGKTRNLGRFDTAEAAAAAYAAAARRHFGEFARAALRMPTPML